MPEQHWQSEVEKQPAGLERRANEGPVGDAGLNMKRSEATKRINGLLGRVVSGEGRYVSRVREVWVFGSFARGALEVGDIDVAVEFDQTKDEAGRWFATPDGGRLRPSRRDQARASRQPARARAPLQRAR
jgi:hypothetical protein